SRTWEVRAADGSGRGVAKRAGGERAVFEAGLRVAEMLEERGFPAGGPVRTRGDGELAVPCAGEWLALLRYVPGEPVPLGTPGGLATWGEVIGRVHSLLAGVAPPEGLPGADRTGSGGDSGAGNGIDLDAPFLDVADWLRPALASAHAGVAALPGLTCGIVHNDGCEPRRDPSTGAVSVIDWNAAGYGPLLTDVGVARYQTPDGVDFTPFLDAYRETAPVRPDELRHADAFARLRAAMAGWYFAWRIGAGNTVGAVDDRWNRDGLDEARRAWERLAR
ncbi:MAG TPA: phosphotransferase, partial [Armatimonadaceae bacterium]|nr:phosphotransferase [Armatimonadaceae bacterium]